jgi:NADH-quinone oxidoreductase subunit L
VPLPIPEVASTIIVLVLVALGIVVAFLRYGAPFAQSGAVDRLRGEALRMPAVLTHAFYVDDALGAVFVRPAQALGRAFGTFVDPHIIDAGVRDVAWVAGALGVLVRALQTGLLRAYALTIVIGAACFLAYFAFAGTAH